MSEWDSVASPVDESGTAIIAPAINNVPSAEWGAVASPVAEDAVNTTPATSAQSLDFSDRESADLSKRWQQIKAADSAMMDNQKSNPRATLDIMGAGAGAIGDTIANTIGSMARQGRDYITDPTSIVTGRVSPEAEKMQQQVGDVGRQIGNFAMQPGTSFAASPGDLVRYISGQANDFKKQYPETAGVAGDIGNIASAALPLAKGAPAAVDAAGTLLSDTGQQLIKSGADQTANRLEAYATNQITPKLTAKQAFDRGVVGRTNQGFFGSTVAPTTQEKAAIDQVMQIPEFKPGNTYVQNYKLVDDSLSKEAENLKSHLQDSGAIYDPKDLANQVDGVADKLSKTTFFKNDMAAQGYAQDAAAQLKTFADANPKTPAGLLDARKQFDQWAQEEQKNVFANPEKSDNFKRAVSTVRQSTNDFIGKTATPPTGEELAIMKGNLDSAIDEYSNLKQLERHLTNTVNGTVKFSNQQGGIWRRQSINSAAQDAKNLANVKSQISNQENLIKDLEGKINNAPNYATDVQKSLNKQSALYTARDNIEAKAVREPGSAAGRAIQKLTDKVPFKNPAFKTAAEIAGIGSVVGAGGLSMGVAVPAIAGYTAYKTLTSPFTKRIIGTALDKTGQFISPNLATKIPK